MARDVDHVIDATHDPEVTICIPASAIPSEIEIRAIGRTDVFPVTLAEALGVAVHGAHHPGPWGTHRQIAAFIGTTTVAFRIDDVGLNTRQRQGGGAWLGGRCSRQRADHHSTGFGLPPGVDDRTAIASNHIAIPHPCLRIDRFADRAQEAEAAHVELIRNGSTVLHESPDRCRSRIEDRDPMLLNQLPEGAGLGGARCAFIHHRRCTVR